jgi:hypothetical protein
MAKGRQVAGLKYLLFGSTEIGATCKRVLATLIDESEGLKKPVKVRFEVNTNGFSKKELLAMFHDFSIATSSGCKTHFHELLAIAGSDLNFSYGGDLLEFECGFWSEKDKKEPRVVEITRSQLQMIDLSRPGLYPSLEKDRPIMRAS